MLEPPPRSATLGCDLGAMAAVEPLMFCQAKKRKKQAKWVAFGASEELDLLG